MTLKELEVKTAKALAAFRQCPSQASATAVFKCIAQMHTDFGADSDSGPGAGNPAWEKEWLTNMGVLDPETHRRLGMF